MGVHNEIILIALSIKAGIAPFHFWFPQVIKIAGWAQCAIILTWQKIAPFVLLASRSNTIIAQAVILCSALVGALGGLNQLNIKNILTYSSIVHSAWILALCSAASISAWGRYFIIYSTVSLSIVIVLYKTNTQIIPQILRFKWNNTTKTFFIVRLISLGGLPPFLGFLAKLGAIQLIILTTNAITTSALITASLVSLFYYTRVIYTMLIKTRKNKIINNNHSRTTPHTLITLTIAGNIIAPALVIIT